MPKSWAVFPSSSRWANKSSDLPLCIISSRAWGTAMPGSSPIPAFPGMGHGQLLWPLSVLSAPHRSPLGSVCPPKTTLQVDFANQLHVQVVSPRVLVQARIPK